MRHETPHHLISHRKHGKCNLAYKRNKIIANQKKAYKQEKENTISKSLLLGCALAEATAIYGFVIALLIILFLK